VIPNKLLALLCGCFIYFILGGCAAPTGGMDPAAVSVDQHLKSLPAPPTDKARVIIYRDSGYGGMLTPMNLNVDGKTVITMANKTFEPILLDPGPKEVNMTLVLPGNPTCTKTIFIAPNQLSYIKLGERNDYNKTLANLIPLASILVENAAEKNTRCGGPWEPFLVREVDALKEIKALR